MPCALTAMPIGQDPLLSVFQEYVQKRNACIFEEQRCLVEEQAWLKAKRSCAVPGDRLAEWTGPNFTAPLKPPGVFEPPRSAFGLGHSLATSPLKPPGILERNATESLKRVNSSRSLASTAATASGDDEDGKIADAAVKAPGVEEVIRELRFERLGNGHLKACWTVAAKRLRGKDQQIVSPSIEISPGSSFKLMLKPKPKGDKKGQASFSKARGIGSVDLKFMEGSAGAPTLRFRIAVGAGSPHGPIQHDFSESATVGSLAATAFDFASTVEPNSSTFLVSLEVLP